MIKHFTIAYFLATSDTYHSSLFGHFMLKLSQIIFLSKKTQPPPVLSPINPWLQRLRHHCQLQLLPEPPIAGKTQVVFCVFRLDFSFSFRFSSSLTFLWFFLGLISTPCWKNSKFQVLFLMNHNIYTCLISYHFSYGFFSVDLVVWDLFIFWWFWHWLFDMS